MAAALVVTSGFGATAVSANAQSFIHRGDTIFTIGDRDRYRYWRRHHDHDRWDRYHRDDYRWRHYRRHDNGAALGAGIAGLAVGALIGGALAPRDYGPVPLYRVRPGRVYHGRHVARCEARYRSYDRRTDTFLGYDGYRHRCRL
ncbi:BA14K family protein [Jiella sp. MQZ9-1]|uniref:BA14K family protein n=1 Tax=Jiella flava TaxID=2816857 RepID=UPI001E45E70A|nr:BA14K family protein [Jiella flava]MCD2470439.1 BA14K family protein [Jiella flava]